MEVYLETQDGVVSDAKYLLFDCEFSEEFKAHLLDTGEGLVGLHVLDYASEMQSYYLLLRYDGYELNEVCKVPVTGNPDRTRACIVGETLYVFSDAGFAVAAL